MMAWRKCCKHPQGGQRTKATGLGGWPTFAGATITEDAPPLRLLSSPDTSFTVCPWTSFTVAEVNWASEPSARRSSSAGFRGPVRGSG